MDSERAFVATDATTPQSISPTDISQFVRLDQCERYLRLRLKERQDGSGFMRDFDVTPQAIPPILTKSGVTFEETVEEAVRQRSPAFRFTDERRRSAGVTHDNANVIERVRGVAPGEALFLFQPRLQAELDGWRIRGDVDVLRLERISDGRLHCLIADMKSSTATKVEHRLQVAFYHEMLDDLLAEDGIEHDPIELAILYRGPAEMTDTSDHTEHEAQQRDAERTFGASAGLLERVTDPDAYLGSVHDLVTSRQSTARRVLNTDFDQVPFHLTYKCDGCLYNEFCMKRSAETGDLSLLPHITEQDKQCLQRAGVTTVARLASLKVLRRKGQIYVDGEPRERTDLVPTGGNADLCRKLAATWPVGERLDELIHRALRYQQWQKQPVEALSYIPNTGYGSLPYSDAGQNPNLVRIYIDAQHDYLHDRIYMLGALVVGNEHGKEHPGRRRTVVRMAEGLPDSPGREEQLFVDWLTETLRAVVEVAAPNADGEAKAPIHLIFVNGFAQRLLLDGLARHANTILGATALYDFMTQLAAFDSPIASYLEQEVSERKNYPMICQSLQAVAAYLKFDWNQATPYRDLFRTRMFDFWGRFDKPSDATSDVPGIRGWYTSRARFNSQIPLEYAYAAWGEFPLPDEGNDAFAAYRAVTIERHVDLSAWKRERLASPEQRVLAGQTLIARYLEEDQEPGVAEQNRENEQRRMLNDSYRAAWREEHPAAKRVTLPKEQREESRWTNEGMRFRLRIECADVACDLNEALNLTTLKAGDWLVIFPRFTVDSRLPEKEQYRFTPTAKQMLYGMRGELERITVDRVEGRAVRAWAEISMNGPMGGSGSRGFLFGTIGDNNRPLEPGTTYTLDANPNDIYGYWSTKVTEGLMAGGENTLYTMLSGGERPDPVWPEKAAIAQQRFLDGLDALHAVGAQHDFEPSKREFISQHGDTPLLLVQGPPGTGKSYSTAFALLARLQGAMAASRDFRIILSCKTHAATDVLLQNVVDARERLRELWHSHPDIMTRYVDPRLLDLPMFRVRPRGDVPDGVIALPKDEDRQPDQPKAIEQLQSSRWWVAAATPGAIYGIIKDRWSAKDLFGRHLADCLVLDEASQMNLPEAAMAALPLTPSGQVIVVGDHRQMPPIVKHDWASEPRRSFQQYRTYESLFLALLTLDPPMIQFEESFRLHADMAEFLRREIYQQDGINYHSRKTGLLETFPMTDDFVAAVLASKHPLTVVVHDEHQSLKRNAFEQKLLTPILETLADPAMFGLDSEHGLGVVVPHRAQRAELRDALPVLTRIDPDSGAVTISAVDTVERFQGGERIAILIGATESDREYILANGEFLLDPRRLTVALSRAKRKLVLVASRSVFEVFSSDEETFAHAQLWKNLLRRTCTVPLWEGERHGHHVTVWGNQPHTP